MERAMLNRFAHARVTARFERGFLASRLGWAPYLDEIGLLSAETMPDGLFVSEQEALHAGERYRQRCQKKLEVAPC
ncbi:hypothetical protein [Candidatus Magnetaquiglobus chichijimensis]